MATELRLSAARAFDRACALSRLPTSQLRYELSRALRSPGEPPISRHAIEDWRSGRQPVDFETVLAACQLAGAKLTIEADGAWSVHFEEPAAVQSRPRLRAAASGRIRTSFVPVLGGLGLAAFLAACVNGWLGQATVSVIDAMQTAASTVVQAVPGPVPAVASVYGSPAPSPSNLPSPRAGAGAGPRILANPTAAPASPLPSARTSNVPTSTPLPSPQTVAMPSPTPRQAARRRPPPPASPPPLTAPVSSLAADPLPSPIPSVLPDPSPTP